MGGCGSCGSVTRNRMSTVKTVKIKGGQDPWLVIGETEHTVKISLGSVIISLDKRLTEPALRPLPTTPPIERLKVRDAMDELEKERMEKEKARTRAANYRAEVERLKEQIRSQEFQIKSLQMKVKRGD